MLRRMTSSRSTTGRTTLRRMTSRRSKTSRTTLRRMTFHKMTHGNLHDVPSLNMTTHLAG